MAVVGWILLGIVLLLLFLLFTILFLPICYQVSVKMDQNGLVVKAKASWFFHLIRVFFDYPEPKKPIIKIAWFTLSKKKEKHKKTKKANTTDSQDTENVSNQIAEITNTTEEEKPSSNSNEELAEISASSEESTSEETSSGENASVNASEESTSEEKTEQETETGSSDNGKKKEKKPLKETIQNLLEDVRYYKELWEDGNTKPFVKDALSRVLHILKNLMPRKIKGYVLFGAASPDVTGYVFGVYSVFRALYPKRFFLTLEPDFERKVLEGDLIIKGHFCVFTLLFDALRILFDKRLKVLRKKLDARKNPEKAEQENAEKSSKRKRRRKSNKKRKVKSKGNTKQKSENEV